MNCKCQIVYYNKSSSDRQKSSVVALQRSPNKPSFSPSLCTEQRIQLWNMSETVPPSGAVDVMFHSGWFMCDCLTQLQAHNYLGGHAEERRQSAYVPINCCSPWNAIATADELCRKTPTVKHDCPRGEHQLKLGAVNASCKSETHSFICGPNPICP